MDISCEKRESIKQNRTIKETNTSNRKSQLKFMEQTTTRDGLDNLAFPKHSERNRMETYRII